MLKSHKDILALSAKKTVLQKRHRIIQAIRCFFTDQDFLEVDTPIRLQAPALEDYIEAEPANDCWLRTSPELQMKQLLAAGYEQIFQLGSCFRQGEHSWKHRAEFTMLEWYRANSNYHEIWQDTINLFNYIAQIIQKNPIIKFAGHKIDISKPWLQITVDEAFQKYANYAVADALKENIFEELLMEKIEPQLGFSTPTALIDYPIELGALAKKTANNPQRVERWELYIAGIELANAYSELVDYDEQKERFAECAELRSSQNRPVYPIDEQFMNALQVGVPPSGGIAVGIDRLVMLFCDENNINNINAFSCP